MTVKKFHILTGPFQVTAKLSDLKYELLSYNGRIFIFYVNCLKSYKEESNQIPKWQRKTRARGDKVSNAKRDAVITLPAILSYPLAGDNSADWDSLSAPSSPIAPTRPVFTPPSAGDKEDEEKLESTYFPRNSPKESQLDYGPDHTPRDALKNKKRLLGIDVTSHSAYIMRIIA